MKFKTQIAVITLGLAVSTSLVWSADRSAQETTPTIEGVWQVTRCRANCDTGECVGGHVPAIMTFNHDGTLIAYANPPGTGPLDTPEAGVWQREPGIQNYSFHDISYFYDENGAFDGSGTVSANVHLDSADSFSYNAIVELYDADGNLLFSFCGHSEATRFQ